MKLVVDLIDKDALFDRVRGVENPPPLDCLLLALHVDDLYTTDINRLLNMSPSEIEVVHRWVGYRYLAASDNIISKKKLRKPDFCADFLFTGHEEYLHRQSKEKEPT